MAQPPSDRFETIEYLAVLDIGSVRIGLPQNEIHTLESVTDLHAAESERTIGTIELNDGRWRIFALSEDLAPLPALPDSQRICVLLDRADLMFGIACDKFASVPSLQVRPVPPPETIARDGSPVLSLGVLGDDVLCLTSTQALAGFLRSHGWLVPVAATLVDQLD